MLKLILEEESNETDDVMLARNDVSDMTYSSDSEEVSPYICSACTAHIEKPSCWLAYSLSPTATIYFCTIDCMLRDSKVSPRTKAREKATLAQTLVASTTTLKTTDVEQIRIELDKDVDEQLKEAAEWFKHATREKHRMDFIKACQALRPRELVI